MEFVKFIKSVGYSLCLLLMRDLEEACFINLQQAIYHSDYHDFTQTYCNESELLHRPESVADAFSQYDGFDPYTAGTKPAKHHARRENNKWKGAMDVVDSLVSLWILHCIVWSR